jgi:hypothetical protein
MSKPKYPLRPAAAVFTKEIDMSGNKWNIGDTYRARTGEILEVAEFDRKEFCFRVRHPITLEYSEEALYGPLENLERWAEEVGLQKIEPK